MSATLRWQRLAALPVTFLIALALVLTTTVSADASGRNRKLQRAANIAVAQIGDPYNYGSDGPSSFDCSGLTSFAYHKAGLNLPRTSSQQAQYTRRIKKSNMRRGDLVFFTGGGGVYHVGMFLKRRNGKPIIIHSPSTGSRVHRTAIWTSSWFAGTVRGR
jgi:cell wall-associated NlpC family hydrolase